MFNKIVDSMRHCVINEVHSKRIIKSKQLIEDDMNITTLDENGNDFNC